MKSESILARESSLLAFTGRFGSLRVLTPIKIAGREVADCAIRRGALLDGAGARIGSVTFDAKSITIVDHHGIACLRLDRLGRSDGVCHIEHPVHRGQAWETYLVSLGAGRAVATTPKLTTTPAPTPAGSAAGPPPPPPLPSTVPPPVVSGAGKGFLGLSILMAGVFALVGLIFFLWPVVRTDAIKQPETERSRVADVEQAQLLPVQPVIVYNYVQQSTARLRRSADQGGELIRRVPIAARCELKANSGEWCMVNCDDVIGGPDGFVACEVLGNDKPTVESVKAQLVTAADANARFSVYLGLVGLEPHNPEFIEGVRTESASAHFSVLAEIRTKPNRKPPVRLTVRCAAGDTQCLTAALGTAQNAHVTWRANDFDATMWIGDDGLKCRVAIGFVDEDAGYVVIEQEQRYTDPPEPFMAAFGPTSGTDDMGDPTKIRPEGPAWVIVVAVFPTASAADSFIASAAKKNYPSFHRLWMADWESLSDTRNFAVYDGPFAYDDRAVALRKLNDVRRYAPGAYGRRLAHDGEQESLNPLASGKAQ